MPSTSTFVLATDFQDFCDATEDFQTEIQTSIEAMQSEISSLTEMLQEGDASSSYIFVHALTHFLSTQGEYQEKIHQGSLYIAERGRRARRHHA